LGNRITRRKIVVVPWETILAEHGPLVWRLVNRVLGNEHDAADCHQTVFVEALEASQPRRIDNWPGPFSWSTPLGPNGDGIERRRSVYRAGHVARSHGLPIAASARSSS
jgi:hypothetical protein